jgi:hypothetical protein
MGRPGGTVTLPVNREERAEDMIIKTSLDAAPLNNQYSGMGGAYSPIAGDPTDDASLIASAFVLPTAKRVTKMTITLDAVPGVGNGFVVYLRANGVNSNVNISIGAADSVVSWEGDPVGFDALDVMGFTYGVTGTPDTAALNIAVEMV